MRKRSQYYIEIYSPPYPYKGFCIRAHRGSYNSDALSPGLVQLIKTHGYDKQDAISNYFIFGGMRVI